MINGLYLRERLPLANQLSGPDAAQPDASLLERWQQQLPFRKSPEWMREKLRAEHIDEAAFFRLVQQPDLAGIAPRTEKAASDWSRRWLKPEEQVAGKSFYHPKHPQWGFLNIALPPILAASRRLARKVSDLAEYNQQLLPKPLETSRLLQLNLFDRLLPLVTKTMIRELQLRKQSGQLTADTPAGRYQAFIDALNTPAMRQYFLDAYPVLVRQVIQAIDDWQYHSGLVLERLVRDFPDLCQQVLRQSAATVGALQGIQFGAGDPHRGGSTVAIVHFSRGARVVYKPRSLAIDRHFQELIHWVNERSDLDYRLLDLLERPDYGWVSFVDYQPCHHAREVERFYQRLGGYLAILYALEATDFHYENIIARGAQPMLIDLESFFHPYAPVTGMETNESMESSVLRTGLLPQRISLKGQEETLDISGLSDVEGQASLFKVAVPKGLGTDEATMEREHTTLRGAANIPMLEGRKVKLSPALIDQFQEGFTIVYRLLMTHQAALTDPADGLLQRFAAAEVRVLFRDTMVYGHLLEEARHPQIQRNGLELERHLDWLWAAAPDYHTIKQLIPHEKASLLRGDIPIFSTRVGERHLYVDEETVIRDFFTETGLELVSRRINSLSEQDLERQSWIIQAALRTQISLPSATTTEGATSGRVDLEQLRPASRDELLAEARRVGDYLYDHAFKSATEADWIALRKEDGQHLQLMPMPYDLFAGMTGEIWFLAQLGQVTSVPRYTELAAKGLNSLRAKLDYGQEGMRPLGLYAGWGSIFFLFTRLGQLWGRTDLLDYLDQLHRELPLDQLIAVDRAYGIVKGSAGFIMASLIHAGATGSRASEVAAIKAGEHLLQQARRMPTGIGWQVASTSPLAGLSHGAAGIALALHRLYRHTGEERYLQAVRQALAFEETLFDPAQANWEDRRDAVRQQHPDRRVFSTGWSHGAPGIALARMELLRDPALASPALRASLDEAIATTLRKGMLPTQTLSMGAFGNTEVLHHYGLEVDEKYRDKSLLAAAFLLRRIAEHGWQCGLPGGLHSPGLMTGVTGIGYQCLRLAAPDQVPSVLLIS